MVFLVLAACYASIFVKMFCKDGLRLPLTGTPVSRKITLLDKQAGFSADCKGVSISARRTGSEFCFDTFASYVDFGILAIRGLCSELNEP